MTDSQAIQILSNLKVGQSELVEGTIVQRIDDTYFVIKGTILVIEDTIKIIKIINNSKKTLPFKKMAFCLVRPPSYIISIFKVEDKEEYDGIVRKAKNDNLLLYYTFTDAFNKISTWLLSDESTLNINKNTFTLTQAPDKEKIDTTIDNTLDDNKEIPQKLTGDLKCPFCGKNASSTPGRTLHVKTKHPDKYEEYRRML